MKVRIVRNQKPIGVGTKLGIAVSLFLLICTLIWAQQPVAQGPQAGNAAAWLVNASQWAGSTLGAPANYGTSPGAVLVPGVNAYITNTPAVTFAPVSTSGGAVSVKHVVESTSTYDTVKGSAGNVYGLYVFNPNTSVCYLMFYNNAAPTIGTTANVEAFGVQAGLGVALPIGTFAQSNFSTAITVANTTTDGGSSVCTTGMSLDVWYQ
jgi:hypothetical protein